MDEELQARALAVLARLDDALRDYQRMPDPTQAAADVMVILNRTWAEFPDVFAAARLATDRALATVPDELDPHGSGYSPGPPR